MDCFISLPKAKQHVSAGVTHAMKNLVGTLPASLYGVNGSETRQAIHSHNDKLDKNANSNLCRVVLDLNSATKIHLAVIDAIKTTIGGEGPWCGTMENRTFNKLIISKDVVAADTISTQVIGFDPNAADYTNTFALSQPRRAPASMLRPRDFRMVLATDAISGATDVGLNELTQIGVYLMATEQLLDWLSRSRQAA